MEYTAMFPALLDNLVMNVLDGVPQSVMTATM